MGHKQRIRKKVLIALYDMEIGGVERSLINMLHSFDYDSYDVDLFICRHTGEFMPMIPAQVNVLPERKSYTAFRKSIVQCLREGLLLTVFLRLIIKFFLTPFYARRAGVSGDTGFIQMQLTAKFLTVIMPSFQRQYDVAISYSWPHDIVLNKVMASCKIGWIHTDYSMLAIDNKLDGASWRRFDYIASISEACTDAFLSKYPSLTERIIQIENITSPHVINKMTVEVAATEQLIAQNEEVFNIVSVGRLAHVKGFDMAIEALRMLHDKGLTQIKWYVIGYGVYEAELRKLIVQHRLEDSFVLLGKQLNPYAYIKACDLYVQPSRFEGKAVTVTEAQIVGKPVLITHYPTAHSQVSDGVDGYICELSVIGIAAGIERLYMNNGLRERVIERVQQREYSNVSELKKLYEIIA